VLRIKNLFQEIDSRSETGIEELLSVSHYTGVTLKRESLENEDDHLTNAESLIGYKLVAKNDLVINIMLAWNGSLGISPYNGMTSPAYCVYRLKGDNNPEYFGYLFRTSLFKAEFRRHSTGILTAVCVYTPISFSAFLRLCRLKIEQDKIVKYIKAQEEKINLFIQKKQRFIELLKEQRLTLVNIYVLFMMEGLKNNWPFERRIESFCQLLMRKQFTHKTQDHFVRKIYMIGDFPFIQTGDSSCKHTRYELMMPLHRARRIVR
jgi:restriction endonuclease S subunit